MTLLLLLACSAPADEAPPCTAGALLDASGACVPAACGASVWGDAVPDGPLVHVDAASSGDGSAGSPFARVQDGLDLAAELGGATVLVAAGTYAETLVMGSAHDGVHLRARCADLVTIDGSLGSASAVLTVTTTARRRPTVEVSGLTLTGGTSGGVRATDASLTLRGVVVRDNAALGILGTGADLVLEDVDVTGTQATDIDAGIAVGVQSASTLTMRGGEVADNASAGIYADASTVDVEGTRVHDNRSVGLGAGTGTTFTGRALRVERHTPLGVYADASTLTLSDTVIADVEPDANGIFGYGISVSTRARVTLTDVEVARATAMGIVTVEGRSSVDATRLHVHDTRLASGEVGHGVAVQDGGTVTLRDSRIEDNRGGLYVLGEDSSLTASGTRIAGSRTAGVPGTGGHPTGQGILTRGRPTVRIEGCTVEDNDNGGIIASGGILTVSDTSLAGNGGTGIFIASVLGHESERPVFTLERSRVEGTHGSAAGIYGRGVEVMGDVDATLRDVQIVDNLEVGAYFADNVDATLANVEVRGTRRSRTHSMASGLVVASDTTVVCRRCTLADNEGPGAYMGLAGTLDLYTTQVEGNRFAGLVLLGNGWLNVHESTVSGSLPDEEAGGGFGVYAMAVRASDGGWSEEGILFLTDSEVGPHRYAAVWLDGPGEYQLRGNTLHGSEGFLLGEWQVHGNALFATNGIEPWSGFTGLLIEENTFRDAADVGMLLHGATGRFGDGNVFRNNGIDLIQQRCVETEPIRQVPPEIEVDVCPYRTRLVDRNTSFQSIAIPEAAVLE